LLDEIAAVEGTQFHWPYITLFLTVFVVLVVTTLLRGSNGTPSPVGIQNCSPIFWVLYGVFHLTAAVCWGIGCLLLAKMNKKKQLAKYEFVTGDVVWTNGTIAKMTFVAFLAGLMSSGLGLGGGVVYSPLLLAMGLLP
jgi:hypothetical protein